MAAEVAATASHRDLKPIVGAFAVGLISIVTAYFREFTGQNLSSYDDEGMLMIDNKRFLDGHALYNGVSTPYGPFYYLYEWCAHALTGTPVSHDSVRFVSMFFWVTCALLVFLLVYRVTNSVPLAAAAHLLSFRALGFIGLEPAHPQELCITLLVALGLAACTIPTRIGLMFSLGFLAGAMTATKINLGVFAVIALTLALLFAMRRGRRRTALLSAAGCAALVFPVILMRGHLADWWAEKYCFVAVISLGAAMVAVSRVEFEFSVEFRDFVFGGAGFAVSIAALGWFAVAHGSSVYQMMDSLIFQPQRSFGKNWFLEARIPDFAVPWALLGLACAVLSAAKRGSEGTIALLKLAFAAGVVFLSTMGDRFAVMSYAPPFLWLVAIRPEQTSPDRIGGLPRAILTLAAVIQVLYAYPVAGAQASFVTVMIIASAAICFSDSLPFLNARFPQFKPWAPSNIGVLLPAIALTMLYLYSAKLAIQDYAEAEPLGLPGTARMRIDHPRADIVRSLARKIDSSGCTMLASAPGLMSFNFLTGTPAPTSIDFSAWMLGLSDAEQLKAVAELAVQRHPCVLYNQSLIDFWTHSGDVSSKPLIRFMKENFEVVFETSGYQLMEPREPTPVISPNPSPGMSGAGKN